MRGSTALAERLSSSEFRAVLTAYRRQVSEAARASFGIVDKFIGDGALVVFGLSGSVENACGEAIRFSEHLIASIPADLACSTVSGPIRIGVGVHFGSVFCGVVGDGDRMEFTVLGDTVNVAARLQEQSKAHDVSLLVSAVTLDRTSDRSGWRRVGSIHLPGRIEPVETFTRQHPPARLDQQPDRPRLAADC